MKVYQAINNVQRDLAKLGIAKNSRNTQGSGYNFRGIDAVYNALSPLMAEHGLIIMPRVIERDVVERQSKQGGALFYTVLTVEYDFISAEDGSKHTVRAYGEAMDSGDKSTNKAMSAAYKYAAFQAFCIPTEAQDADAETHEVSVKTVTDEQVATLEDLIEANGRDKAKLLQFFKVASLSDLTEKQYAQAVSAVNKSKKEAA